MFKLIKYELRATFLTILGICISVMVASILLMTRKGSWDHQLIIGLAACLVIGALIVICISSLKIMSRYLHGDEGYLLFTLPQSGTAIITSRLITAIIQISIVLFVSLLMFYLIIPEEIDLSLFKEIKFSVILFSMIQYVWGIFYSLTFIYFCMVIGKVALKGKKLGKVGSFIIFIILSVFLSWLSSKIGDTFPQTISFGSSIASNVNSATSNFSISGGVFSINIANSIFDIIAFVGFFISSTHLIDKRLDLS